MTSPQEWHQVLSLVEKSVRILPLEKQAWEARAGIAPRVVPENRGGGGAREMDHRNESTPIADETLPLVFPSTSHLRQACLASSSSPPTRRNHRKTLVAVVEKWILQNHSKQRRCSGGVVSEKDHHVGVRVLSKSRLGTNNATTASTSAATNPRVLLDQFVAKLDSTKHEDNDEKLSPMTPMLMDGDRNEKVSPAQALPNGPPAPQKPPGKMGCPLLPERDPSRSLLVRCHRTLVDGEVFVNSGRVDDGTLFSHPVRGGGRASSKQNHQTVHQALLRCAASLYHRLWYFRTIQKKDLRRVHGFALSTTTSTTATGTIATKVTLWVSLLVLERPSSPLLGGRYPLCVYTQTHDLSEGASSSSSSATEALYELAGFLFGGTRSLPCPYRNSGSLGTVASSPGGMLLPDASATETVIPDRCEIVPTITGSLVVRCHGSSAARALLESSSETDEEDESEAWNAFVASFVRATASLPRETVWYAKYKTPSFGPFWKTSQLAINGPRGGILRTKTLRPCLRRWLAIHPVDGWVGSARSITVTKSAGVSLSRAIQEHRLSWRDFSREYLGLARSTLELQAACQSLVHGDIHEGNILYYCGSHDGPEDRDSKTLFSEGHRLVLIDWDEASRPKPFHRKTETEEELLRYPEGLVDFPEQYTQQQLMHLFAKLARTFYPAHAAAATKDEWIQNLAPPVSDSASERASLKAFLGRSVVEQRFRAMLKGLEEALVTNHSEGKPSR